MTAPPPYAAWRLDPPTASPSTSLMYKNQSALPRLPVPPLPATLAKLAKSVAALGTPEEIQAFKSKMESFAKPGAIGEVLQKRLEERREEPGRRNWISEWWDMDAYMSYRDSVVINVSYYYGFSKLPQAPAATKSTKSDPSYVAATIATTALSFRNLIAKGLLEPEPAGKAGGELCMESYKWAYNACRIPAAGSDYAVKIPEDDPAGQHLVVVRQGRFWSVPLTVGGKEVGVEGFKKTFDAIVSQDIGTSKTPSVGIFTGVNRDLWADARAQLVSDSPTNTATLRAIETSAFVISLDESSPEPSKDAAGLADFSKRIWHGEEQGGNRWWDKPLQYIVFANGEAGFVGEHSCMDGTPTARLNDFLSKRLLSSEQVPGTGADFTTTAPAPLSLPFVVSSEVTKMISTAEAEFKDHIGKFELVCLRYDRYGKDGIKAMGVSPDAWAQMLFQIAYYMTHGKACGTYEAAQVRLFQLGRTETIRIATEESVAFTKALIDPKVSDQKKKELLLAATKKHGQDAKDASTGFGIDRHLFGLRKLLKEGETAELLKDPLVAKSSTWNLSTSQIYIRNAPAYGWGPVVEDGYGVPYMIHPECLQFVTSSRKEMPTATYLKNIEKAADLLMDVMERCKEAKL
ncbi:hypothetical protein RQP46_008351 [Phenoliferia psychrophenolica]